MSTCRDGRSAAAARVTARQARDASKYFSIAPYQVLSCIEYAGTLCYLSRSVYGLPTFYWEFFFFVPQISQKEFGNHAKTNIKMVWPYLVSSDFQLSKCSQSAEILHFSTPSSW
jgi:hypothetical protein